MAGARPHALRIADSARDAHVARLRPHMLRTADVARA
jgi:hypothetical protein